MAPTGLGLAAAGLLMAGIALTGVAPAHAADAPVDLGAAETFSVLAGSTVTNTGASTLSGDIGVTPGSAVTGFPPGIALGTFHVSDAVANTAQGDLTTAYNDAAGRPTTAAVPADLGGLTLTAGVYSGASTELTGTLTLDAQGDPNAVFIFKSTSTLITATNSSVLLINGASPCHVFWQVATSATLGTNTQFAGTVMALTSSTLSTGANVNGRVLARNGAVTLDTNVITTPNCAAAAPTVSPSATPSSTPTATSTGTPASTPASTTASTPSSGPTNSPTAAPTTPGTPGTPTDAPSPTTPVSTPGVPTSTPPIPVGNPPTGLGGAEQRGGGSGVLFLLAGLAALGTVAAHTLVSRSARRR